MYKLTGCESSAETIELGDKVYEKLEPQVKSCIENNIKFIIDFSQITSMTTKFLNNAIGNLFINLDYKKLMQLMTFSGLDMAKKATLKWSLGIALQSAKIEERQKYEKSKQYID